MKGFTKEGGWSERPRQPASWPAQRAAEGHGAARAALADYCAYPPPYVIDVQLPIVMTWASKARLPIRQLLIPLSYTCLLGGLNTTIGESAGGGGAKGCRQGRGTGMPGRWS